MEIKRGNFGVTIAKTHTIQKRIVGNCMENQQIRPQAKIEDEMPEDSKVCMNPRLRKLGMTISKKQIEQLCKYLSAQQFNVNSSHMVQKGKTLTTFSHMTRKRELWIIDSRATDHMTKCEKFTSYIPSPRNHNIKIVDRSYLMVIGINTTK